MKTISAKISQDSSFSFSRRFLNWKIIKKLEEDENKDEEYVSFSSCGSHHLEEEMKLPAFPERSAVTTPQPRSKKRSVIRSALTIFGKNHSGLGTRVIGTLFGHRRGHVHLAFQEDARAGPAFLIELAMPTSTLVREMASGLVRIALECEKKKGAKDKLLQETVWRTYCNGKKCGLATRRERDEEDTAVLKAVGPISMGAGVLPGVVADGEVMYMRARFERVVGSKDSEAFYMMNPDGAGGPELSVYMIRV